MLVSMTSFGRTEKEVDGFRIILEIKTVNGRFLDTALRFPKNFQEWEDPARKRIAQSFRRGRVEVFAQVETLGAEQDKPDINPVLARLYWARLQDLHRTLPGCSEPTLQNLLSIPHIFEARETVLDRDLLKSIMMDALSEALDKALVMRVQEGETLMRDMEQRLELLSVEVESIAARKDGVLADYLRKLRDRIRELLDGTPVDESRLLQEAAMMAERSDVTEEIVRIRSHLDQMRALFHDAKPAEGRTLDFITQELHREVNTIGSKSTDLDVVQSVVRMKSEIGKLREQVQNIE
ncbi:MAG: YicC/YloC family endoribonuclease [Syntrophobacteraceae bacterium]